MLPKREETKDVKKVSLTLFVVTTVTLILIIIVSLTVVIYSYEQEIKKILVNSVAITQNEVNQGKETDLEDLINDKLQQNDKTQDNQTNQSSNESNQMYSTQAGN